MYQVILTIFKRSLQLLILFIGLNCLGQTPRALTKKDVVQIETLIKLSTKDLSSKIESDNLLYKNFVIDTFKIEERQRLKLDIDYTTSGMINSTINANKEYDKLLNKYYQILLRSLKKEDQQILRQSQRNWLKFRDSELKLNSTLTDTYYSGGGTIQGVIEASRITELTRNRVIELYHYISRKM